MADADTVYVCLITHTSKATGSDRTYLEGDRLQGDHADVTANESFYADDGLDAEAVQAARDALEASWL